MASSFLQLAQGRADALNRLYDIIGRDIFGYIRSIVGASAEAEDVFQEVFVRLASLGSKAIRVEKPVSYLFAIARNEAYKALRHRAAHRETSLDEGLLQLTPERKPDEVPFTPEQIAGAISELPLEQREAIVLKIFEGFTFAQIANVTQVSPNTAASRYRYGVDKLAEKLARGAGRI